MLILAAASAFFWVEVERQAARAWEETQRADKQASIAEERKARAERELVSARFNLAKAHEEKAVGILSKPEEQRGTRDYQHAVLHGPQAERQSIGGKSAPSLSAWAKLGSGALQRTFNIRPLRDPPKPGEDKLDQLLRWIKEQGI
jgi:hypothetical protein